MGLKDVVVAASPDGILVSDKEQSGYLKKYVERLDEQVRYAEKSWGEYRVLDIGDSYETVKITVLAGHRMSYHSHQHRDEMWTVISGKGRTIVDGMEQNVEAGDVITMQAGCRHTVIAETDLNIIEVQIGREISAHDKQKYELER
jgi:mannose-1-phosphate guanylyltransferase